MGAVCVKLAGELGCRLGIDTLGELVAEAGRKALESGKEDPCRGCRPRRTVRAARDPGYFFCGSQSAIISSRSCTRPSACQLSEEL